MAGNESKNIKITPTEFSKMSSEEKIMKMAGGLQTPPGKPKAEVLDSILNKIEKPASTKTRRLNWVAGAAAATIVLLLSIYSLNSYLSTNTVKTKFAEQTTISLPDGSMVVLNAGSKINWSDKNFSTERVVTLRGEAYFNVKKGNKFTIKTKNGLVEVLGTQLNVFSRDKSFWASCVTGKVRVSANNRQQLILPGDVAELTPNGLVKTHKNNIGKTISWKEGVFHFEDKPLVSIFAELERQFNVSIEYEKEKERRITVTFSNKKLNEALDIVCIPMGLKYEVDKNQKVRIFEKQK